MEAGRMLDPDWTPGASYGHVDAILAALARGEYEEQLALLDAAIAVPQPTLVVVEVVEADVVAIAAATRLA